MERRRDYAPSFVFLGEADQGLMADFVTYMRNGVERRFREDTIRTYVGHLSTYLRRCDVSSANAVAGVVTRMHLTRALTSIEHHQVSARRNTLFAVKVFAHFLHDWGLLDAESHQAIATMKFKSRTKPVKMRISERDAETLMRHVAESSRYDERQRLLNLALLATLGYTGLRNSEVCRLRIEDIDFARGAINVVDGKGGKARTVGLPDRIVPLLRLYLTHRGSREAETFFVGMTGQALDRDLVIKRLARLSRAAGIKVGAHMLRRRFATRTAHLGVPLDKLQVVMGHADIQTTRGYVQTSEHEVVQEMRHW